MYSVRPCIVFTANVIPSDPLSVPQTSESTSRAWPVVTGHPLFLKHSSPRDNARQHTYTKYHVSCSTNSKESSTACFLSGITEGFFVLLIFFSGENFTQPVLPATFPIRWGRLVCVYGELDETSAHPCKVSAPWWCFKIMPSLPLQPHKCSPPEHLHRLLTGIKMLGDIYIFFTV